MLRIILDFDKPYCATFLRLAALAIFSTGSLLTPSLAQQPGQKTFSSSEDASSAFVTAAQSNDEKAMLDILGPDGKQIVSSGDDTEDANNRANFAQRYQEMHRLAVEPDGSTTLYIGAENWPTPIPLLNKGNLWFFDTDAAKKEILYRRIGHNETSAISVSLELVAAQKEYWGSHDNEYAQKIFSDTGRHNGLYWKAAGDEAQSPIGPLVAAAVAEGYPKGQEGVSTPYRGYYFRILTQQKKTASSGAKNYVVHGKMSRGFAFVAYPAEYRSSGVMTFIVNADGVVYEKDLGDRTGVLAKAIKAYNPDPSWQEAEEQPDDETIAAQDTK
ncbi:MAG: DUF2950 domain-containing protein [Candidatus Sulfotelmatobacter sp.]|jgi:hypothetical protein